MAAKIVLELQENVEKGLARIEQSARKAAAAVNMLNDTGEVRGPEFDASNLDLVITRSQDLAKSMERAMEAQRKYAQGSEGVKLANEDLANSLTAIAENTDGSLIVSLGKSFFQWRAYVKLLKGVRTGFDDTVGNIDKMTRQFSELSPVIVESNQNIAKLAGTEAKFSEHTGGFIEAGREGGLVTQAFASAVDIFVKGPAAAFSKVMPSMKDTFTGFAKDIEASLSGQAEMRNSIQSITQEYESETDQLAKLRSRLKEVTEAWQTQNEAASQIGDSAQVEVIAEQGQALSKLQLRLGDFVKSIESGDVTAMRFRDEMSRLSNETEQLSTNVKFIAPVTERVTKAIGDTGTAVTTVASDFKALEAPMDRTEEQLEQLENKWLGLASASGKLVSAYRQVKKGAEEVREELHKQPADVESLEKAWDKFDDLLARIADRLNNPPKAQHKLPTGLRESTAETKNFARASASAAGDVHKFDDVTGKAAKSQATFAGRLKGSLKYLVPAGAATAAGAVGFVALAGAATAAAGAFVGVGLAAFKWLQTIPEAEAYNDQLAAAQLNTAQTAQETELLARELRAASGYAISTGDALAQLGKTDLDLGVDQQVELMKFASLQAKRMGQDVASTNDQVLNAIQSGSGEALQSLGLLPGGIDAVAAKFDQLHGVVGLFEDLTESERQAVIQTEALGRVANQVDRLEAAGFESASAMDTVRAAIADVKEGWTEAVRNVTIFGKTSSEWMQIAAAAVRDKLRPYLDDLPATIQAVIDKSKQWVKLTLRGVSLMIDAVRRFADLVADVGRDFQDSWLASIVPGVKQAGGALESIGNAGKRGADALAELNAKAQEFAVKHANAMADAIKSRGEMAQAIGAEIQAEDKLAEARARSHELHKKSLELVKGFKSSRGGSAGGGDSFGGSDFALQDRLGGLAQLVDDFENGAARAAALAGKSLDTVLNQAGEGIVELHDLRRELEAKAQKQTEQNEKQREKLHQNVADALAEQLEHIENIDDVGQRALARKKAEEAAEKRINQLLKEQTDLEKAQADERARQLKQIEAQEKLITDQVQKRLELERERSDELIKQIHALLTQKDLQDDQQQQRAAGGPIARGGFDGASAFGDAQPAQQPGQQQRQQFGFAGGFFGGRIGFDPMQRGFGVAAQAGRPQAPAGGGQAQQSPLEQIQQEVMQKHRKELVEKVKAGIEQQLFDDIRSRGQTAKAELDAGQISRGQFDKQIDALRKEFQRGQATSGRKAGRAVAEGDTSAPGLTDALNELTKEFVRQAPKKDQLDQQTLKLLDQAIDKQTESERNQADREARIAKLEKALNKLGILTERNTSTRRRATAAVNR